MCSATNCPHHPRPADPGRRRFLQRAAVTGATPFIAAGLGAVASRPRTARANPIPEVTSPGELPPEKALEALYKGNARFVRGEMKSPNRNMDRLKQVATGQKPFAAFLGCADSRVPIEIVFDQGFGDLFVTRIAGNVADPAIIGSLEFGTHVLGAKILYVLGHTSCGAVAATLAGSPVPGQISTLYSHIYRAAKLEPKDVDRAVAANVRIQAEILAESSPVIAKLVKEGKLLVTGGVYDLITGKVTAVDVKAA